MTLCIICFPSSGQGMSASVCYACIINTRFFFLEGIDLNKQKKTEKQWLLHQVFSFSMPVVFSSFCFERDVAPW